LVEHSARDYVLGWSPDGKWICFASDRSGTTDLWVIGVSDGKPQGEPQKISRNIGEILSLGITDEGSLYFGLDAGGTDIYVGEITPETGMLSESPRRLSLRFEGTNDSPDWSPDGKDLLYQSDREAAYELGATSPFCIYSMETGEGREVPVQLKEFYQPRYSPDGRFATAFGADNADQGGLFQIDLESGSATILVKSDYDLGLADATWSPKGDKLYYTYPYNYKEPTRVIQYDLETGEERELYREESWPTCTALSPDGKWLTLQTVDMEKEVKVLSILPTDGSPIKKIVSLEEGKTIVEMDWMPDGENILYIMGLYYNRKQRELWQVSIVDKNPKKIGEFEGMSCLSVHSNGRQIAFSAVKRQTEVWVMENFLPED
jgi:Tol biopolymer transport system component